MHFGDLLSLILENLGRRKARVALTAVGVIIGTAAVVVLVSLAVGLQENATRNLYGISDLTQVRVSPSYGGGPGPIVVERAGPGGGGGSGAPQEKLLTLKALEELRALPNVTAVIPRDYLRVGVEMKVKGLFGGAGIIGIGTDDLSILGLEAQAGTLKLEKGQLVVGYTVPQNFFNPFQRPSQAPPEPLTAADLLEEPMRFAAIKYTDDGQGNYQEVRRTIPVRVVGVIAEARDEADWTAFMRLEDVDALNTWAEGRRVDRNRVGYEQVILKVDKVENALQVADQVRALGYGASAPQEQIQQTSNFFLVLQVIFGGVGAIALLVAAIGIANTMTMAILERTREIGLMKAVGATNQDVLSVFLGEAAGIGFIGGLGGVALGWGLGQVINVLALVYFAGQAQQPGPYGPMPGPTVAAATPAWLPAFAVLFATLIGLLSGVYPALRAATLVPVMALKYE